MLPRDVVHIFPITPHQSRGANSGKNQISGASVLLSLPVMMQSSTIDD
jgi:hypothetical protein